MPPNPEKRNPASGETDGAFQNNCRVIFPEIFRRVNNRARRLQEGLAFNEAFADAVERDLRVRCMRRYLAEE